MCVDAHGNRRHLLHAGLRGRIASFCSEFGLAPSASERASFVAGPRARRVVDFHEHDAHARAPNAPGPYRSGQRDRARRHGTVYLGQRDDQHYTIGCGRQSGNARMDTESCCGGSGGSARFSRASIIPTLRAAGWWNHRTRLAVPRHGICRWMPNHRLLPRARARSGAAPALFLDVCTAVELRTSPICGASRYQTRNILVNRSGIPKRLDFGICSCCCRSRLHRKRRKF